MRSGSSSPMPPELGLFVRGHFDEPLIAAVAAVAILEPVFDAVHHFRNFSGSLNVLTLRDEHPRLAIIDNIFQLGWR